MIRAVLFDLDGTLYDRDAAIVQTAEDQYEVVRHLAPAVDRADFVTRIVELDGHGYSRPRRMHHLLADALGWTAEAGDRLEECFRARYPGNCRLESDTIRTLGSLRDGGLKVGMVTNGPVEWQSRKIRSMALEPFFDVIVISEAEGVQKPDPRIFELALERCAVEAADAVFVGDHPENDIFGAANAGMRPVWKAMPYWNVPPEISRIGKISDLLRLVF